MKTSYFLFLSNENSFLEQELEYLILAYNCIFSLIQLFAETFNGWWLGWIWGAGTFFCSCSLLLEFVWTPHLWVGSVVLSWGGGGDSLRELSSSPSVCLTDFALWLHPSLCLFSLGNYECYLVREWWRCQRNGERERDGSSRCEEPGTRGGHVLWAVGGFHTHRCRKSPRHQTGTLGPDKMKPMKLKERELIF